MKDSKEAVAARAKAIQAEVEARRNAHRAEQRQGSQHIVCTFGETNTYAK